MSFLSDYTEKNSNLIPKIDIPCFTWNSQAEQGLLFFKAKSLDTNDFYDLIEWSKSGGYQGSVILFFDFESGKVFKPFAKKRNVIYSNPVYAEGFYYFLQGDYDEKKISLYHYIPGKLLEKETELSTEEVSLYNLCIIGNPVHIISQEDTFVCYYPEKISFPITGHESALFIEDEKIYFGFDADG